MKMFELAATKPSKQAAKVYESYFGDTINVDVISPQQARTMLNKVQKLVTEHRSTPAFHHSEKNPTYLKLMMLERVLKAKVKETATIGIGDAAGADKNTAQNSAQNAQATPNANVAAGDAAAKQKMQQQVNSISDPKLKSAMQKAAQGQTMNTVDQQLVAQAALQTESKSMRRQLYRILKESEVQQAQVVLAAQAMSDDMQNMLEEVSSMQFKDLPALITGMKDQIGVDQAMQFNTSASTALGGLVQAVQGAKDQMDQAIGAITGQSAPPTVPGQDDAVPGEEFGDELPGEEPGIDAEPELDVAELPPEDPETDNAGLGRAKR